MAAGCDSADPLRQGEGGGSLSTVVKCSLPKERTGRTKVIEIANDARIDIAEEVRKVIAFHLPVAVAELTEDAKLTDLGADSIDLYEVIMSLEEKFGITIDDRDAQRFVTVGDAIAFVKGEVGRF
jgi:acyl carrier protein